MALKSHYQAALLSLAFCSPAVLADATPVRSMIQSFSDIQLIGADDSDLLTVVDQQTNSSQILGPAISTVLIDSEQGHYTATTGSLALFNGPSTGSFFATANYTGSRGTDDVTASSWEQTLWCIFEYDFTITDTGTLQIDGDLFNGGPSALSYFGFVQIFTEDQPGDGFDESFFIHEIFDFGMDGENIDLDIPLDESSKSYRIHIRIGHIGTTILDAALSTGSLSVNWTIDAPNPCRVDIDGDGVLDFFDVSLFLEALMNNDPSADYNADGIVDFFDVSTYLAEFDAGCPSVAVLASP